MDSESGNLPRHRAVRRRALRHPDPKTWMTVEEFADECGVTASEVFSRVVGGELVSQRYGDDWYVPRPRVLLRLPGVKGGAAKLSIGACRLGDLLTAGRGTVVARLRPDDPDWRRSMDALFEAEAELPSLPVPVRFDGREWLVDASLWGELAMALLEYEEHLRACGAEVQGPRDAT